MTAADLPKRSLCSKAVDARGKAAAVSEDGNFKAQPLQQRCRCAWQSSSDTGNINLGARAAHPHFS